MLGWNQTSGFAAFDSPTPLLLTCLSFLLPQLCSDKTGTLTLNKMVVQEHTPVYVPGMDQPKLLRFAAMAAKWKEPARDALDTLVLGSADLSSLDDCQQVGG